MARTFERLPLLDVLRGFALVCIMLDHTPDSVLAGATLAKLAFFDAAELFVVLAGFLVGALWIKLEASKGRAAAQTRFLRRSGEIYRAYLATAIVMGLLSALFFAVGLQHSAIWPGFGENLIETPHLYLIETASFWRTPNLIDVLALYVVLLAMTPLAMPLLRRRPLVFMAVSAAIWAVAPTLNGAIPTSLESGGLLFNPFGWQLLFFSGAFIATYRSEIIALLRPVAAPLTVLSALLLIAGLYGSLGGAYAWVREATPWKAYIGLFGDIDKWRLDEVRFVSLLAAFWLVSLIRRDTAHWIAGTRAGAALAAVGRRGLASFCIGVLLTIAADALARALAPETVAWPVHLLVDVAAIAALVASAYALEAGAGERLELRIADWTRRAVATALPFAPFVQAQPALAEAAPPAPKPRIRPKR